MGALDTLKLPDEPFCATAAWRAAIEKFHGLCQCSGQCGRKHAATKGRCDQYQGLAGVNLQLSEDGAVYCPRCFGPIDRTRKRAASDAAAARNAERFAQEDLFTLLGGD